MTADGLTRRLASATDERLVVGPGGQQARGLHVRQCRCGGVALGEETGRTYWPCGLAGAAGLLTASNFFTTSVVMSSDASAQTRPESGPLKM